MNWKSLPKEQRERLMLKTLLAAIAVVALWFYGIRPLLAGVREQWAKGEQIDGHLEQMTRLVSRQEELRTGMKDNVRVVRNLFTHHLPPEDNPFLWATERVYRYAREYGVGIESITEVKQALPIWVKRPEDAAKAKSTPPPAEKDDAESGKADSPGRRFAPYTVQITARCAYANMLRMVAAVERDNPYVSVTMLSITADETWPEQQSVRIFVEWPRHAGPLDDAMRNTIAQPTGSTAETGTEAP